MANKTLYVGNLSYTITEQQLAQHFQAYGATQPRIMEGRGFGFIDISEENLLKAIDEKNSTQLEGRTITVSEARPKGESGGGGQGGSRTGGRRW